MEVAKLNNKNGYKLILEKNVENRNKITTFARSNYSPGSGTPKNKIMPTRIRLQRHGKKGKPFYQIVVADSRSKRDGKYIDNIGSYNPNTNPATIELDFESAVKWVKNGAQPSDTMRAILSYKGVLMYDHLMRGVAKGAFTEEVAKEKFAKWQQEKQGKIDGKIQNLASTKAKADAERLAAEAEVNAKREADIAAKNKPEEEQPVAETEEAVENTEAAAEETSEETKAEE